MQDATKFIITTQHVTVVTVQAGWFTTISLRYQTQQKQLQGSSQPTLHQLTLPQQSQASKKSHLLEFRQAPTGQHKM